MKSILISFTLMMLTGCMATQKYMPMTQSLGGQLGFTAVAFGDVTYAPGKEQELNSPSVRKGKMTSPYDGSYAEYIRRAFITELVNAGKYSENSMSSLALELRENRMTSPVAKAGEFAISANVVVSKGGNKHYEKIISVNKPWSVPFAGDDARNKASKMYVLVMREFVRDALTDADIQRALAGK